MTQPNPAAAQSVLERHPLPWQRLQDGNGGHVIADADDNLIVGDESVREFVVAAVNASDVVEKLVAALKALVNHDDDGSALFGIEQIADELEGYHRVPPGRIEVLRMHAQMIHKLLASLARVNRGEASETSKGGSDA